MEPCLAIIDLHELAERFIGGDEPSHPLAWYQVAIRAIVVYLLGLLVVRIGKSRVMCGVTALDVILGFVLGSVLSRGITGHASLSGTFVASAALVAMHWCFTWIACHSHSFGMLIKGGVSLVVENGQPLHENLRQSHLSLHDLEQHLRLKGVESVAQVKRAYKERNGEISVIRFE